MAQAQSVNASTAAVPHPRSERTLDITTQVKSVLLDATRTVAGVDSLLEVVGVTPPSGSTTATVDRLLDTEHGTAGRTWPAPSEMESLRDSRDRLSAAVLRVATLISRLESSARPRRPRA